MKASLLKIFSCNPFKSHFKNRILVNPPRAKKDHGGTALKTEARLIRIEDLKRASNKDIGPEDEAETASGYRTRSSLSLGFALGICTIFFLTPEIVGSQINQSPPNDMKIHVRADKAVTSIDAGETEFIGNVQVTRGDVHITAERMKIFYKQDSKSGQGEGSIKASIKTIVATGNVKITKDNLVALSETAAYEAESDILILTGNDSKVISGTSSITGSKFTLYQATEDIIVESSEQNQVKTVFYPGSRGLF